MRDGALNHNSDNSLLIAFAEVFAALSSSESGLSLKFNTLEYTDRSLYQKAQPSNTASYCAEWGNIPFTVDAEPSFSFAVLERLLGGSGSPGIINRPLSMIEQAVLGDFFDCLIRSADTVSGWCSGPAVRGVGFGASVSGEADPDAMILAFGLEETGSCFRLVLPASEKGSFIKLFSSVLGEDGTISVSAGTEGVEIPAAGIGELGIGDAVVFGAPDRLVLRAGSRKLCRCRTGLVEEALAVMTEEGGVEENECRGEIAALFGRGRISPGELASLDRGLVIRMDRRQGDPVQVLYSGKTVAEGEFIMLEDKLGVRIRRLL